MFLHTNKPLIRQARPLNVYEGTRQVHVSETTLGHKAKGENDPQVGTNVVGRVLYIVQGMSLNFIVSFCSIILFRRDWKSLWVIWVHESLYFPRSWSKPPIHVTGHLLSCVSHSIGSREIALDDFPATFHCVIFLRGLNPGSFSQ